MSASNRSLFRPWSKRVSATSRTAVYGPVRTVVWEGRSREAPPYPDPWPISESTPRPPWRQLSGVLRAWRLPLVEAIISSIRKRHSRCVTWRPVLRQVLPWQSLSSAAEIDPDVWSGRASQEGFVDLSALWSCINVSGL